MIVCQITAVSMKDIYGIGRLAACALAVLGSEAAAADWPMFRGGPALLGVAEGSLPDKLSLLWSFKTGGAVKSSAAVAEGRVFVGSSDEMVYALDFTNGKKVWAFKTGGAVESSPLVLEQRVY